MTLHRRQRTLVLAGLAVLAGAALLLLARGCRRSDRPTVTAIASPGSPASGATADPVPPVATTEHRLRSLVLHLGPAGLRLDSSAVLPGRAKAPPRSIAADRLEFTAHAADGRVVWSGSIDHPLHRRLEYESTREPGRLEQVPASVPENLFDLRLPADPPAVRLVVREVRAGSDTSRPLGELTLP